MAGRYANLYLIVKGGIVLGRTDSAAFATIWARRWDAAIQYHLMPLR